MNYYNIGQQIRKYRRAQGMSQEQLSEKVGISVTHMSHIETGNTKLSLAVFVDIVQALDVTADDLLSDGTSSRKASFDEVNSLLDGCTTKQLRIITDIIKATKASLDKHEV